MKEDGVGQVQGLNCLVAVYQIWMNHRKSFDYNVVYASENRSCVFPFLFQLIQHCSHATLMPNCFILIEGFALFIKRIICQVNRKIINIAF